MWLYANDYISFFRFPLRSYSQFFFYTISLVCLQKYPCIFFFPFFLIRFRKSCFPIYPCVYFVCFCFCLFFLLLPTVINLYSCLYIHRAAGLLHPHVSQTWRVLFFHLFLWQIVYLSHLFGCKAASLIFSSPGSCF